MMEVILSRSRNIYFHVLSVFAVTGCFLVNICASAAAESCNDLIEEYQNSDLAKSRELAEKNKLKPVSRLIFCLSQVHDLKDRNLDSGLTGLKKLYDDKGVPAQIRQEAGLSYARIIQLLKLRNYDKTYNDVDTREIFLDIMKSFPGTLYACMACIYQAEDFFNSEDPARKEKGFELIESFLKTYKGDSVNTVPLHLYADKFYISIDRNYGKSFEHLKTAYEIGITNDVIRREALFRLGRICDVKLNDKIHALFYYRKFTDLYPDAALTPIAWESLRKIEK